MKKTLILLALICFSTNIYSQIDRSRTTTVEGLGSPMNNSTLLGAPKSHSLSKKNNGLFNSTRKPITLSEEKEETFNMTTENGLKDYKMEGFVPKAFTKDKAVTDEYRKNAFLGNFATGGTFVEVYCRDHEYVDGDRVRIYVNGEVVANNVKLGAGYYPVLVTLKKGSNIIEFEALNQGTSGPNTAEVVVYDDDGQVLTQNEWNLTTGMKASLTVVKE